MGNPSNAHRFLSGSRLFVAGAGYVGGAVVEAALAAGAGVVALTRNEARAGELRAAGAQVVVADLALSVWHEEVRAADFDFVLNCVSAGGGGLAGYQRSYVEGNASLVAWAERAGRAGGGGCGAGHLIYTGTTSVYGEAAGARVGEDAAAEGGGERGGLLREAERIVATWPGAWTVLRLAGIYGPGRSHLLAQVRDGGGEVAGRAETHLNLIHRDDIVAAILATWARGAETAGRVFNVADDGAAPKGEVVAWLAARLRVAMPRFSGSPAGGRRELTPDRVIANDRFKAATGWAPRYPTYREGYAALLGT